MRGTAPSRLYEARSAVSTVARGCSGGSAVWPFASSSSTVRLGDAKPAPAASSAPARRLVRGVCDEIFDEYSCRGREGAGEVGGDVAPLPGWN